MTPETLARLIEIRGAVSAVTGIDEDRISQKDAHGTFDECSARLMLYLVAVESAKVSKFDVADFMDVTRSNVYKCLESARNLRDTDRRWFGMYRIAVAASQSESVCPCCRGSGVVKAGGC